MRCILVCAEATSACGSALLGELSDTRPRLSTSAPIHLPMTASLSPRHTRRDLHLHTQKPPGSHGRVCKPAKSLLIHPPYGPEPTLKHSPPCWMAEEAEHHLLHHPLPAPDSLCSSAQVCHHFLYPWTRFPSSLEAKGRAQSHRREGICFLRKAAPAVGKTKHRKGTNSIPRRSPVLSFSNHTAILLLERDHFKHAIMLGIVQSST